MRQSMRKQKKFMSSKSIYFLPLIRSIKLNTAKAKDGDKTSPILHRSIEEIIENKCPQTEQHLYLGQAVFPIKNISGSDNLYNKYEYLPKIYLKKNRRSSPQFGQIQKKEPVVKTKRQESREINIPCEKMPLNKQNISNFNNFFYKDRFNRRLENQIQKMQFKLNYHPSEKILMLAGIQQTEEEMEKPKFKYTKINLDEKENELKEKELQKVPQFLMKILDPLKHF